jgi:DNA-3-methyladenine glycosylase II
MKAPETTSISAAAAPAQAILHLTRKTLAEGARVLRKRDPRLAVWMDRVGPVSLRRQRHQFGALCRSILSQQLGAQAAKSIHQRLLACFAPARDPDPQRLLRLRAERLRRCGVSRPKIAYLRALAHAFHDGDLRGVRLSRLPEAGVVELLTRLPGIGVWTAEMFLIFSLGRLDVFSVGDFALREGVRRVEGRDLRPAEVAEVARRWAPYRSVAALYLWKVAHWKEDGG